MILGHEAARAFLWSGLARDKLHHALLFEGPRGVGKRAMADLMVRAANCTDDRPIDQRPCDACATCRALLQGMHPDCIVLEPDADRAAQKIPIERVREAIRQTQYHRYGARQRFVVIDPAEAMQEPAANALLKTLEEPPAGTGFVLITHNARALLPTILSRCQRVRFGAVPVDAIQAWLAARGVAEPERAARLSLGCPGRALDLATEGLEGRDGLRTAVGVALAGGLPDVYALSARLTQGARQEWSDGVGGLLEILEELVRDASITATRAAIPTTYDDGLVTRLAGAWPDGLARCGRAIQEARDDLEVFGSGKTVLDALLTAVRQELRSAPASG